MMQPYRIQHFIEQLLGGTEVDLVMKGSILEELKDNILKHIIEAIYRIEQYYAGMSFEQFSGKPKNSS